MNETDVITGFTIIINGGNVEHHIYHPSQLLLALCKLLWATILTNFVIFTMILFQEFHQIIMKKKKDKYMCNPFHSTGY